MYIRNTAAFAALSCAVTSVAAIQHGDTGEHLGLQIRWHQLGQGVFTGVPDSEWNETIHQRSDEDWGLDAFALSRRDVNGTSDLEVRNFVSTCQAVGRCFKSVGDKALDGAVHTWFRAAAAGAPYLPGAVQGYKDIMSFLNQPFYANALGVGVAGYVQRGGQSTSSAKEECSTSKDPVDALESGATQMLQANPKATKFAGTIIGPTGTWQLHMAVTGSSTVTASTWCS
ncbi:hypothetical protein SUNI508_10603 [Seiridium unicorne]|uniref:Uncharacterized protein n=1 Tax=Seiridium unicorne TaxID=138068 RepID=A0ABR2UK58_9PEZI